MNAKKRYDVLSSERSQFLDVAERSGDLTLPYLIRGEEDPSGGMRRLKTPCSLLALKV